MDNKERADFDQLSAEIADLFPSLWWRLYTNCKKEGFSEAQAFSLLQTYILSIGGTVTPPEG